MPWLKRRRTFEIMPSSWMVPYFLFVALPRVPNACVVVRVFAPLFWMVLWFLGRSSWWLGFLKPVTWVTTIRLWFLKVLEAFTPVSPVVEATMMFLMCSSSPRFFASLSVCSVFCGPGFSK